MDQKINPSLKLLPISSLVRGKFQPRKNFNEEEIDELAHSIKSNGLLQPILARPLENNTYEIIAGERRWRAAKKAGLTSIYCLVNLYSDAQAAEAAIIENLTRVDLNPIEEAKAYQRLIEEFRYSHEELAATMSKSRTTITNSLRLLKLSPQIQHMIIKKEISEGHAKMLAGLLPSAQQALAHKTKTCQWSVRQLEKVIKALQTKSDKKFNQDMNILSLEHQLSAHIGCPVKIEYHQGKGKLTIAFHDNAVLEGLLKKIGFNLED